MSLEKKFSLKTKILSFMILGVIFFFLLEVCAILVLNLIPNFIFDQYKIRQDICEYL